MTGEPGEPSTPGAAEMIAPLPKAAIMSRRQTEITAVHATLLKAADLSYLRAPFKRYVSLSHHADIPRGDSERRTCC
jgi:hypothetical protein